MPGGGQISPLDNIPAIHEIPIVDGVRMLLHEHVEVGRTGEVRHFEELEPGGIEAVGVMERVADQRVQRDASQARPVLRDRLIGRTLVNPQAIVHVRRQLATEHIGGIGILHARRPVLDIIDPALAIGLRVRRASVIDQEPVAVIGVQLPGQGQLSEVIAARGCLGAHFRPR